MTIPGFTRSRAAANGIEISFQRAGRGAALVLLHGYPQNGMCWSRVAPELAQHFDVIIPDLRGYGQSDAPPDDREHTAYCKRTMATDIIGLLDTLSLDQVMVLGHDRGARVSYRMALDHPKRVTRLGIIEVITTADLWSAWNAELAMAAYHWTFLAQPYPLPERMIGADPTAYIDWTLASWTKAKSLDAFPPAALESYRQQARDPARIHAMCADYRAGAGLDRELDQADRDMGRKIAAPLHFLWSDVGFPAQSGTPAEYWKGWTTTLTETSCQSGHFVMEENPKAVLASFMPFFKST